MLSRRSLPVLALAITVSLIAIPAVARAEAPDFDLPGGHYFSQTGGYEVVDRNEALFWSEFQRLGGVDNLGYPISGRFTYKGFLTQAFQKVVLQWRPDYGRAVFLNVFDELSAGGKDDWLYRVRSTPRPLVLDERGKSWDQIVAARLALLDSAPAIKEAFLHAANPVEDRGLPTSRVEDFGPLLAVRAQRVVIQQWKNDTPWARAGQVVVANGGEIAKEAGLFPASALATELPPDTSPVIARINEYRAAAGVPLARSNPALLKAAEGHVAYYDANRGDPSLSGMGLHQEKPGAPGFTGASMGDRARAAGYSAGAVTENAGFGAIERALDWYMDTVNHRLPQIHPNAVDFGHSFSGVNGFHIISVGVRREKLTTPLPSVYPADGATDVPLSWDGAETPNPAPGIPRPLGYPLTVAFNVMQKVEWRSFELLGPSGEPLEISTPKTDWMRAAAIIPHRPLGPGQTYTARVEAVVDGKTVKKEWSFTTRG